MKVYTKLVIDIASGEIEHEESYEYDGPVILCGGSSGGGGGDGVDEEYNDRMATIHEAQQAMAEDYHDFWKSDYQGMEREQIAANRELIPYQKDLAKDKMVAEREILPLQTGLTKEQIASERELLPLFTGLSKEQIGAKRELLPIETETTKKQLGARQDFIDQARKGVDVDSRVSQAEADVRHGFGLASAKTKRDLSRSGLNVSSGRYGMMMNDLNLSQAKTAAGARTKARRTAEEENFNRLRSAASIGMA
ncbi:hypothetical protein [Maridesulfovibrio sp.]|uniref:hypothetical protein n=1 Tax=Maridesulfovibrio sp. TaxID=2795000 RepID=UPI003B004E7B